MDLQALGRDADLNMARTWAALGRSMGGAVMEHEAATFVATGVPMPFFNGAFVHRPPHDPQSLITAAIDFFDSHCVGWLLWVREDVAPAVLEAGRSAGLRDAGGPPALGLAPIPSAPPLPGGLQITPASTLDDIHAHAALASEGFGLPAEISEQIIRPGLLEEPSLTVFIGRVGGEPVSCSLLGTSDQTAGVYNVATPAAFRGRGYGAALTWAAVSEGARRGCTQAILQASELGYPVYKRMGFVDLGRYVQLQGGQ